MKILSPLMTFVLLLLYCAALAFFLMIAMNGFPERKATQVFIGYFMIAAVFMLGSSLMAWYLFAKISSRLSQWAAYLVSILISTVLGAVIISVLSILLMAIVADTRR